VIFDWNHRLSRKWCEIGPWLLCNVNRKSWVADRSVSVPMTLSDRQIVQAGLPNNARIVWHGTTKFGRITHDGRGVLLEGRPRHHRKGRGGSQYFPILGVPLYLCVHPLTENYQIWRGNTYGEGLVFNGSATAPVSKGRSPQRSPILGFSSVYAYNL